MNRVQANGNIKQLCKSHENRISKVNLPIKMNAFSLLIIQFVFRIKQVQFFGNVKKLWKNLLKNCIFYHQNKKCTF